MFSVVSSVAVFWLRLRRAVEFDPLEPDDRAGLLQVQLRLRLEVEEGAAPNVAGCLNSDGAVSHLLN